MPVLAAAGFQSLEALDERLDLLRAQGLGQGLGFLGFRV